MPKTTVNLDAEFHKEIRHFVVDFGISFQEMTIMALKEFMQRHKNAGQDANKKKSKKY